MVLFAFHLIRLKRFQPNKAAFGETSFVNKVTCFYVSRLVEVMADVQSMNVRTSGKHTLHKIPNVAENDPKTFCNALLAC